MFQSMVSLAFFFLVGLACSVLRSVAHHGASAACDDMRLLGIVGLGSEGGGTIV